MALSEKDFPTNLPEQYRKCFEELHELLNLISFALREVEDETWRRKLVEMCILALGVQELPGLRKLLGKKQNIQLHRLKARV